MARQPITHAANGQPFRRPVTPTSSREDLFQCALVLDREPSLDATRAQLVAAIWPDDTAEDRSHG